MLKWIQEVRKEYSFFGLKLKTLLVLDNLSTHDTINVKEKLKRVWSSYMNDTKWPNMKTTAFDISINKVIKENLRSKYVKYYIEDSNFKVAITISLNGWMKYDNQTLSLSIKWFQIHLNIHESAMS